MSDVKSPALLPCPFCGGANIDPEGWASIDRKGPACDDCSGCADTVELWNSRPSPASPPAEALLEQERLWKIIDDKVDALNKLTAERDRFKWRVEWLEKHQRRTYRAALEAAKHWLEEERDSDHPGQTEPNDILKVIDAALGPAEALRSQTSGAEAGGEAFNHADAAVACRGTAAELMATPARDCNLVAQARYWERKASDHEALAKPVSEPAGGGVDAVLAIVSAEILKARQEPTDLRSLQARIDQAVARLSAPASSSPAEAEALQAGVEAAIQKLRKPVYSEDLMKRWDHWRKMHKDGFGGSATRDEFESIIDHIDEERSEIADMLASLSSAPAQEDGSKELGAHPRGSGQSAG